MTDPSPVRHIDLSHTIEQHMTTYPGLPGPVVRSHLTRDAAEVAYGPGVTFHIGVVEICTNTGTYLDMPHHRFADGDDLADVELDRVAGVPAVRRGPSIPHRIIEHLTSLDGLPASAFRFTAVPRS